MSEVKIYPEPQDPSILKLRARLAETTAAQQALITPEAIEAARQRILSFRERRSEAPDREFPSHIIISTPDSATLNSASEALELYGLEHPHLTLTGRVKRN